jgi:hypothetical protein
MEINRDVECFGTLENRPEQFVIEITALDMTVDERSLETVIMDRALQLGGSGVGIDGRQCGKSAETSRMAPHGIREEIVRFARQIGRLSGFELLCAGRGKRQYLHIDVSGVHFRDPVVAKIAELFKKFNGATAEFQSLFLEPSPRTIQESRNRKMFFKGYSPHNRSILNWRACSQTILSLRGTPPTGDMESLGRRLEMIASAFNQAQARDWLSRGEPDTFRCWIGSRIRALAPSLLFRLLYWHQILSSPQNEAL